MLQRDLEVAECKRCHGTGIAAVKSRRRGVFEQFVICACVAGRGVAMPVVEVYRYG